MYKFSKYALFLLILLLAMPVAAQDNLVQLSNTDALGDVMVGPNGMTLYIFTPDPLGETVCYDRCAENWPPLLVESADEITADEAFVGEFSTVERTDGTLQVAYNGLPLYYFIRDEAPGDTNGQARGGVWWVIAPADVYVLRNDTLGHILVGPSGDTLYLFTNDEPGVTNCYEDCATNWPPLLVDGMDVVGDPRLPGELGTVERTDGTHQVSYNGWPLYYFARDEARGDVNGEGRGEVWYALSPEILMMGSNDDLGDFLTDANGMTVYLFDNDEPGMSNCTEGCLENWPAVTIYPGDRVWVSAGISGELGTIERDDGDIQVTYNGMPLYYFAQDEAPGDTTGQGRGEVWWVVEP